MFRHFTQLERKICGPVDFLVFADAPIENPGENTLY